MNIAATVDPSRPTNQRGERFYGRAERDIPERVERAARDLDLELISWKQIKLGTVARYLVKNLIPAVGLVIVYGPPKCGKTFWIFDLVMHIALGWSYRGRRTHQGTVVYCLFEGQMGFTARVEAFRQKHLAEHAEDAPFYLMDTRIALVADHPRLIAAIRRSVGNQSPAIIVIDTLNRSFTGSESSDVDMTAYVAAADTIRAAFNCAVVIVHHCGLEGGRPRGHTALLGAGDAQIGVIKDAAKNIIAAVEYMKEGADGETVASRLEVVEVGIDDDGESITSCAIVSADDIELKPKGAEAGGLTKNQRTMLDIVFEAGLAGLTVEEWNERARAAGLGVNRKPTSTTFAKHCRTKG